MELDRTLYQRSFSHLKASPERIRGALELAETRQRPKRFLLRRALVAGMILALAAALATGVAAAGGELLGHMLCRVEVYRPDGNELTVTVYEKEYSPAIQSGEGGRFGYRSTMTLQPKEGSKEEPRIVIYGDENGQYDRELVDEILKGMEHTAAIFYPLEK